MKTGVAFLFLLISHLCLAGLSRAGDASFPDRPDKRVEEADRIAFVHLKFVGDRVEVLDMKVVDGHLKNSIEPRADRISLQLYSKKGEPMWQGWVRDPHLQRLEFEDAARPGHLRATMAVQENPEITVRIPFVEAGQTVRVARHRTDAKGDASTQVLGTVEVQD